MMNSPSKIEIWATRLSSKTKQIRNELSTISIKKLATLSGSNIQKEKIILTCLFENYEIFIQDLIILKQNGEKPHPLIENLILLYLRTADGSAMSEEWINFRELPDGKIYQQAFQRYASNTISSNWGDDIQGFIDVCNSINGKPLNYGDACFSIQLLPRIFVAPILWIGDEHFSSKASILFDANAPHYMSTGGLAFLGSQLVKRLLS